MVLWFYTTPPALVGIPLTLFGLVSPLTLGAAVVLVGTVVGVTGRRRLARVTADPVSRLRDVLPSLLVLAAVLAVNSVARDYGPELSWIINWNITTTIHAIEGSFVAGVQSISTEWLTTYFSVTYIYGYVILLLVPFGIYFALPDRTQFERTALAFGANYALGLVCYLLFVSYGPRNLIPDLVEPLLYTTYPHSQVLTSKVNANTNVFPSLHTSLSVTVVLLAWQSREQYPRWLVVATPLAASVVVSTMYLGIHWGIDVLAGIVLAGVSTVFATRTQRRFTTTDERRRHRLWPANSKNQ